MLFRCEDDQLIGLRKGMSRGDVRAFMSEEPFSFVKSKFSLSPTDAYCAKTVHVYFDDKDIVRGVEIFRPNELTYNGLPVLGERATAVLGSAFSLHEVSKEYGVGYVISPGTVSLYVPDVDDNVDAIVEAVYVKLL
jgi:hypothetical protein